MEDDEMEYANCDLCGIDNTKLVFKDRDRIHHIEGNFSIVQCRECGLVYLNPRPSPDEIGKYYPEDYSPFKNGDNPIMQSVKNLILKYNIFKLKKLIPEEASILEIGCGTGRYLVALRNKGGWDVKGIEANPKVAEIARNKHGLDIITGSFPDIELSGKFNLVIMNHVFEHLHNPVRAMKKIAKLLKPGGNVIISVPNIGSWEFRLFGRYWRGIDIPRHLYDFDKQTLGNILGKAKFAIDSIHYSPLPNDWVYGLRHYLNRKRHYSHPSFFNIDNPLAMLIFLPFSLFTALMKRSGRISIIARKVI